MARNLLAKTQLSTAQLILYAATCLVFMLSAMYVAHGDIMYDADIARDFLILNEISEKKIVLIGPRSGAAPGLFHGPLWSYLNYPAFYLGQGNPVAVGWFWVLLSGGLIVSCAYVGTKLFGKTPGALFALLVAIRMISFSRNAFNPYGALLLLPAFLYLIIRYLDTKKIKYLVTHVLLGGLLIQFQVAVGAPLMILSFGYVLYQTARRKLPLKHLLIYALTGLTLVTYLAFDLRHDWLMLKSVMAYLDSSTQRKTTELSWFLRERLDLMINQALYYLPPALIQSGWQKLLFLVTAGFAVSIWWRTKKLPHAIIWYFYIGYHFVSLLHRGGMGIYYYFPLFPLTFMLLFAVWDYIPKKLAYLLVGGLIVVNLVYEVQTLRSDLALIGKRQMSWQFHNRMAEDIFDSAETSEFGVFIYAPDVHGYRSKYPLVYQDRLHQNKSMQPFTKLPETFVLLAGPPEYDLGWQANPKDFLINSARIKAEPVDTMSYEDKYAVNRYELTPDETLEEFDQHLNNWLHFR